VVFVGLLAAVASDADGASCVEETTVFPAMSNEKNGCHLMNFSRNITIMVGEKVPM
jgi:hypothetical protein